MNRARTGSIDILLALPLFMAIMAGALLCGTLLKEKLQLENLSWFRGFYEKKMIRSTDTQISDMERCKKEGITALSQRSLPLPFMLLYHRHCSHTVKISLASQLVSTFFRSGYSFKDSRTLQQLLWQENMHHAGYGYLPLQALGFPELLEAIGILNLPVGLYELP